jgi:hypothetical protein
MTKLLDTIESESSTRMDAGLRIQAASGLVFLFLQQSFCVSGGDGAVLF